MKIEEDTPHSQDIEWQTLNECARSIYHKGQRLFRLWNFAKKKQQDDTVLMALYDCAVLLAKKALQIAEKEGHSGHLCVATSIDTLGLIYMAQNRYTEAESLYKRSLSIWEKSREPDHPDIGYALNNLALSYYEQERYTEAEPLFKRALAIWEKALLSENPDVEFIAGGDVADTVYYLAYIYWNNGQYSEVESLYKTTLAVWENILGPDDPQLITTLEDMVELYREIGRQEEAESLENRIAQISKITNGSIVD